MTKTAINKPTRSKINLVAAITALVSFAAAIGFVPPEMEQQLLQVISVASPLVIIVFRTWFTEPKR